MDGVALPVVENGNILYENCRKQGLSGHELAFKLRTNHIYSVSEVKRAVYEQNGQLIIVKYGEENPEFPLITDGQLQKNILRVIGKDIDWVKKEVEKLLNAFHFPGKTEGGADALSALRQKEIECFALLWLENCVKDKSYGSTVFGMIRMSDESLSRKMAEEIGEVLLFIPAAVGLEEKARPVKEVFLELYFRKINGGEEQWKTVMEERGLNGNGSSDF